MMGIELANSIEINLISSPLFKVALKSCNDDILKNLNQRFASQICGAPSSKEKRPPRYNPSEHLKTTILCENNLYKYSQSYSWQLQ